MKKIFNSKVTPALFLLTASLFAGAATIHANAAPLTYEATESIETMKDNEIKEYEFTTPEKAVFSTITVTNTSCQNLTVSILDKEHKEIYKKSTSIQNEKLDFTFETLKSETYHISIHGNEGNYTLDLDYTEDIGGGDLNTCTTFTEGTEYNWSMDGSGDEDYGIFTPSLDGNTRVTITNKDCNAGIQAKIIHIKSGSQIFTAGGNTTSATSATATHKLIPGDQYLIAISGASKGNYSINVEEKKISKIELIPSLNLTVGTPYQLHPSVTQSGATAPFVTYTTSSPSIAVVDANGTINPLKAGKVTITATAADGFGVKAKTIVYVTPKQMAAPVVKNKNNASTQLTLKWNKTEGASGYYIYQYDTQTSTWKLVRTITKGKTLSCTISKLSPLTSYRFRISAYKKMNNVIFEGAKSPSTSFITAPAKTSISAVTYSNQTLKVTPKKLSRVSGYEIRYANTKDFSSYYTYTFAKSSVSFKPYLSNGTWYVQIRAFKNYQGKKVYGKWSATKSFAVK